MRLCESEWIIEIKRGEGWRWGPLFDVNLLIFTIYHSFNVIDRCMCVFLTGAMCQYGYTVGQRIKGLVVYLLQVKFVILISINIINLCE